MMGKTHLTVGIATTMLFIQPRTKNELITTIIGGAIGGVLPDIDVKIDRSNKYAKKASIDALYSEISAAILSIFLAIVDYFSDFRVGYSIIRNEYLSCVGTICFILLLIVGEKSRHRDKTHSLLFMLLFSASLLLINVPIGAATMCGYLSHLGIDLFNKSPERLFYPLKKGICFKLCHAEGLVNELMFSVGLAVLVAFMIRQIV